MPGPLRRDDDTLGQAARRVLRRGISDRLGKRPLIDIQLVRLSESR
jgi:hypothetical protein